MLNIAVCDSSPLLYLYRADYIELLRKLFKEIYVPQAVVDEFMEGRKRGYQSPDVKDIQWSLLQNSELNFS